MRSRPPQPPRHAFDRPESAVRACRTEPGAPPSAPQNITQRNERAGAERAPRSTGVRTLRRNRSTPSAAAGVGVGVGPGRSPRGSGRGAAASPARGHCSRAARLPSDGALRSREEAGVPGQHVPAAGKFTRRAVGGGDAADDGGGVPSARPAAVRRGRGTGGRALPCRRRRRTSSNNGPSGPLHHGQGAEIRPSATSGAAACRSRSPSTVSRAPAGTRRRRCARHWRRARTYRSRPAHHGRAGRRPVERGSKAAARAAALDPRAGQLTARTAVLFVRSGSKPKGYSPNSPNGGWMLTAPVAPGVTVSTRTENANVRRVSSSTQYRRSQS